MITIIATCKVQPGKRAEYLSIARELIEKSRAEAGNIAYDMFEALDDENALTLIERWADQAAIDFHNNTEHFTQIVPILRSMRIDRGTVTLYKQVEI